MENPTTLLIIVGAVCFIVGGILGALLYRSLTVDPSRSRRLSQQVEELSTEQSRYQAQVSEHFMQTASLIKRLNEDYAEMHRHLAKGAQQLCSDESMKDFMLPSENATGAHEPNKDEFIPPRDYAPKDATDERGTLSEDFGFKKDAN